MSRIKTETRFPSAGEDLRAQEEQRAVEATPQTLSPAYKLAFADYDFMVRDELRPVRLQLELLKPELMLQEENIVSTIVVFGSARIPEPAKARESLQAAERRFQDDPNDPERRRAFDVARRMLETSRYYDVARDFARLVTEHSQEPGRRRYVISTGGGPGFMEAANRGAMEAGGESIGLSIVLAHEQRPNHYVTPKLSFQFHYFAVRKMHFLIRAKALACFPGGFGTMDELFETLTLVQTQKVRPLPILLFGEAWWRRIVDFEAMAAEGVIAYRDLNLIKFVETAEEGWRSILDFYAEEEDDVV